MDPSIDDTIKGMIKTLSRVVYASLDDEYVKSQVMLLTLNLEMLRQRVEREVDTLVDENDTMVEFLRCAEEQILDQEMLSRLREVTDFTEPVSKRISILEERNIGFRAVLIDLYQFAVSCQDAHDLRHQVWELIGGSIQKRNINLDLEACYADFFQ